MNTNINGSAINGSRNGSGIVDGRGSSTSNNNKKRRSSSDALSSSSFSPQHSSWQDFSRKGNCFKKLLDGALVKISSASFEFPPSSSQNSSENLKHPQQHSPRPEVNKDDANGSNRLLLKVIEEKKTESILLQQKVDSQQTEITHLQAVVDDLRESNMQQATAETRIGIALKEASQKATMAREQANDAEATAATLAAKVEEFEAVLTETKRASMLLLKEQEEIGLGVERMELDYVKARADLVRSKTHKEKIMQDQRKMKQNALLVKGNMNKIQESLEREQNEKLVLVRKSEEYEVKLQIEQNRSKRLQDELNSAQVLFVDTTSALAESRECFDNCKQALDRMSEANQNLHQQLEDYQKNLLKEKASHQGELKRIQQDHQETQLQLNDQKDALQKTKLEKLATAKQQASKISALERRLKNSLSVLPSTHKHIENTNLQGANTGDESARNHHSFATRCLTNTHLGENENEFRSIESKCSICFRDVSRGGLLMRKCQCGKEGCKVRAHVSCLKHVTTPSSRKLILCSTAAKASFLGNNVGPSNKCG